MHVFTYSEREGTKALEMDHPVDPQVKHQRSKTLLEISEQKLQEFYNQNKGTTQKVLFEDAKHVMKMMGFTENYVRVEVPYCEEKANEIISLVLGDYNTEKTALVEK